MSYPKQILMIYFKDSLKVKTNELMEISNQAVSKSAAVGSSWFCLLDTLTES